METEAPHEMKMEGASGNLMVMAQQSRVHTRYIDRKNPSVRGEESVTVANGKSVRDEEVIIPETEESVKEAEQAVKKETDEGALLLGPDSMADESLLQKEAEAESGKRFEVIVDGKYYPAITHQEAEELVNEIHKRRQALKRALQAKQVAKGKETKAKVEEAGKAEVSVTEAGRPEESATEAEEALKKEAEEGALLVGMDSTGGVSSMQKQAEDVALLNSTGGEPLMGKEAEEESGKRPERQLYAEIQRALLDIQEKLTKKNWKTYKRTLQLLKDMSNKLDMLDQGGDDNETDEIDDRGELDIDQTCLDTNEDTNTIFFEPDKLFLDPLAKEMADEAESFASYSRLREYKWRKTCGFFTDPTVMSSMQFTHYTPGRVPYSMECSTLETLQIISIKLTELADGLELPLSVYGIVFMDKVCIEIELRVKSGAYSQDKALISCVRRYTGVNGPGVSTICFKNSLCTVEVCLQPVKQTVQATILGVQVASEDGSWPLEYGGLVACSPLSGKLVLSDSGYTRRINPSSSQIVLIESEDEAIPKGESGHVLLRRQVVSVQLDGRLDFFIKAYSKSGAIAAETRVHFYPKVCNVSQKKCYLGDIGVTVTVAWSLVAANKTELCFELRGGSIF
ncbi:hypothetical protein ACQ4PT_072064 [Festuca glaucescens]